jgi:hypothetical protein
MDRMYVLVSKLENKPLTKSLGPFFYEKWFKPTRKKYAKIMKNRTNLQKTAGYGYTLNVQIFDLTETWRE